MERCGNEVTHRNLERRTNLQIPLITGLSIAQHFSALPAPERVSVSVELFGTHRGPLVPVIRYVIDYDACSLGSQDRQVSS